MAGDLSLAPLFTHSFISITLDPAGEGREPDFRMRLFVFGILALWTYVQILQIHRAVKVLRQTKITIPGPSIISYDGVNCPFAFSYHRADGRVGNDSPHVVCRRTAGAALRREPDFWWTEMADWGVFLACPTSVRPCLL